MPLTPDEISDHVRGDVSTQSYEGGPRIDGVEIMDLRVFGDDGGIFMELAHFSDVGKLLGFEDFQIRQLNYSLIDPSCVKAWHLHYKQDDIFFVPPDSRILVGVVDVRKDSPTEDEQMRFVLGGAHPRLVRIPKGVAHGVCNFTQGQGRLIYFVDQNFSLDDPDEQRLPWDYFGKEFWDMTKG